MFRVDVTKTIGGEVISVHAIETETETESRSRMDEMIAAVKAELNAPYMRDVGGTAEVYLIDLGNGNGSEVVRALTVKRPLHSPAAMVCEHG